MYITNRSCISPQPTIKEKFNQEQLQYFDSNKYFAIEPNYIEYIPKNILRKMGKAVRMGVGAAQPILQMQPSLEGIIIGTAHGGLEDCIRFLNQIVEYKEGRLTPTQFVQSTANALAGQIAFSQKNQKYNITYSHKGHSFESALLDAQSLLKEDPNKQYLIGSVEEISSYNYNLDDLCQLYKKTPVHSSNLLNSNTKGTVNGEGSAFFLASAEPNPKACKIAAIDTFSNIHKSDLNWRLKTFLQNNRLTAYQIDAIILGYNGDNRTDQKN